MKLKLAFIAFVVASSAWLGLEQPAHCAVCYTGKCYDSGMCGAHGCVCLKSGMDLWGRCVSFQ